MTDMLTTLLLLAIGVLAGVIVGYGRGFRRRPYRPKPLRPEAVAQRLEVPAPVAPMPAPDPTEDAAPIILQAESPAGMAPSPGQRARWQDRRPSWRAHVHDQKGAETLEWLAVGAITVGVAIVVYGLPGGNIITGLNDAAFKLRLLLVSLVP